MLVERGDGSMIDLAADRERLHTTIAEQGVGVVYLDALLDNIGTGTNSWQSKAVRDALAPARQIAQEQDVAVLGAMHPNQSGTNFRQLLSGSHAFNGVSRSSLFLATHPEHPERRVLARGKGNLVARPEAVEFDIKSFEFRANEHDFNVSRAVRFSAEMLTVEELIAGPATPAPAGEARTSARESHRRAARRRRLARVQHDHRRLRAGRRLHACCSASR